MWDSTLAGSIKVAIFVGLVHGGLLLGAAAPLARLLGANGVTVAPAARYLRLESCFSHSVPRKRSVRRGAFREEGLEDAAVHYSFCWPGELHRRPVLCPLAESGRLPGIPDAIGAAALATTAAQFLGLGFTLMALKRTKRLPKVW